MSQDYQESDFSSPLSHRPGLENHVKKWKTIVADTVKAMRLQIQKEEHMHWRCFMSASGIVLKKIE